MQAAGAEHSIIEGELTLDALTSGVSVYQRAKGHRFSSDDTITAWTALQVHPRPQRVLDLGCGLGSVLLHLAWSVPDALLVGVEAQSVSFELVQRNIAHNRLAPRVSAVHGDLRDAELLAQLGGPFDLVTGTPPYFPVGEAVDAHDAQRAAARMEHRGGVEAYVAAATHTLSAEGWFVVCGDADAQPRLERAALEHRLHRWGQVVVIPKVGRPPLFSVWALRRIAPSGNPHDRTLTLRDEQGNRTADARVLRAFSGFPEREPTA